MNIILVIDRFEGKYAILESQDKTPLVFNFPHHLLPQELKEGTVFIFNISIDQKETKIKKERMQNFLNDLERKDMGGIIQ